MKEQLKRMILALGDSATPKETLELLAKEGVPVLELLTGLLEIDNKHHLKSNDEEVRKWGCYMLGVFGDAGAAEALVKAAFHDPNESVRYAAGIAIGKLEGTALQQIFDLLVDEHKTSWLSNDEPLVALCRRAGAKSILMLQKAVTDGKLSSEEAQQIIRQVRAEIERRKPDSGVVAPSEVPQEFRRTAARMLQMLDAPVRVKSR